MREDDPWSGLTPPRSPASGGGVGAILREFHVPWPTADETSLREAATIWHQLAETFRDNYGLANRAATSLTSNNEGAAISAFEQYWDKYGARNKGALPLAAEACDSMSTACSKYADEVSDLKRKIEIGVGGIAASVVIGAVGAFFTFGITEAFATSAATTFVATVAGWIEALGLDVAGWIAETGGGLASITAIISETAGDAIGEGTATLASGGYIRLPGIAIGTGVAGAFGGMTSTAFTASMGQLTGEQPLTRSQLALDFYDSAKAGGVNSMLGKIADFSAPQLANVLDHAAQSVGTSDPELFVSLTTLSRQVKGMTGKVTASVLTSAASQLIATQSITSQNLASDQLQDRLQQIAESGEE